MFKIFRTDRALFHQIAMKIVRCCNNPEPSKRLLSSQYNVERIQLNPAYGYDERGKRRPRLKKLHQDAPRTMAMLLDHLCLLARDGRSMRAMDYLDEGADPNLTDKWNWPPLLYASDRGHLEFVQLLLRHKARVDWQDEDKFTPLMVAAQANHHKIVEALINHGADVNLTNNLNRSALHLAIHSDARAAAALLIDAGAHLEAKDLDDWRPLHYAAHSGAFETTRVLIKTGAEMDAQDKDGNTPLHLAAISGWSQICAELVLRGADPNVLNKEEWTPIHCASWYGNARCIEHICRRSANPHIKDKNGRTALDIAKECGFGKSIENLEIVGKVYDARQARGGGRQPSPKKPEKLDTISLTVGGQKFVIAKQTLQCVRGSYFWILFNPEKKLKNMPEIFEDMGPGPGPEIKKIGKNEYFLDKNPKMFEYILEYLRTVRYCKTKKIKYPLDKYDLDELMQEAKFFRIAPYVQLLAEERRSRQERTFRNVISNRKRRIMIRKGYMTPRISDDSDLVYKDIYKPTFREKRQENHLDDEDLL